MSEVERLINDIYSYQEKMYPNTDPGDITICVQDDIPMVSIFQDRWFVDSLHPVVARTVEEALTLYLNYLKEGTLKRYETTVFGWENDIKDIQMALITSDAARFDAIVSDLRRRVFGSG